MSVLRRVVAVAGMAALVSAAASAQAAPTIGTLPCVGFVPGQATMPLHGAGFAPGGSVRVFVNSAARPAPALLLTAQPNALGAFQLPILPPPFAPANRDEQIFKLIAQDVTKPQAPVVVTSQFRVVRFGMTKNPVANSPAQRVTYTARGFRPRKPVYVHFRFGGAIQRTVKLGVAKPPCGIVSRRLLALPTKIRYGAWEARVDQSKRFSKRTIPQWIDTFTITRPRKTR